MNTIGSTDIHTISNVGNKSLQGRLDVRDKGVDVLDVGNKTGNLILDERGNDITDNSDDVSDGNLKGAGNAEEVALNGWDNIGSHIRCNSGDYKTISV
jgi:hypothetical protein